MSTTLPRAAPTRYIEFLLLFGYHACRVLAFSVLFSLSQPRFFSSQVLLIRHKSSWGRQLWILALGDKTNALSVSVSLQISIWVNFTIIKGRYSWPYETNISACDFPQKWMNFVIENFPTVILKFLKFLEIFKNFKIFEKKIQDRKKNISGTPYYAASYSSW